MIHEDRGFPFCWSGAIRLDGCSIKKKITTQEKMKKIQVVVLCKFLYSKLLWVGVTVVVEVFT